MKADTSIPASQTTHPPLAHDAQGLKLAVPDGTTHWRILRQTGGRPKPVPGHDMQPARFGLHLTHDDLLDLCGAGTYRVEALDQYGNRLACVTAVTLGTDTPVSTQLEPASAAASRSSVAASNDLRIAMETIAQMSRAHSESLQTLANAQADWIKMLATAKAIPRNGAVQIAAPPVEPAEPQAKPAWLSVIEPAVPTIATALIRNLGSFFGPMPDPVLKRRNADLAGAFLRERKALEVKPVRLPTFDEQLAAVCALLEPDEREPATEMLNTWIRPLAQDTFVQFTPAKAVEFVRAVISNNAKASS